jgi:putative aldouronate transport system substrate-binding protein
MMRKAIILVLTLVLVTALFAGCSKKTTEDHLSDGPSENFKEDGLPIVEEEITLNIFSRKSPPNGPYEDMLVFKEYEKMTNINVEWEDVPQDSFAERKNLVFASGELPDAFYKAALTPVEAVKYGSSGILIPLEGLIEDYAPNLTALFDEYPEIKSSITAPDGHIYALPAIVTLNAGRTSKFWINNTWLENLGLEEPTTPDELVEVLTAFKNDDPNGNGEQDEIPMTQRNFGSVLSSFSGSWGLLPQMGNNISIENDKVSFWTISDRYKEYLQFLNKLYSEGLLDRDVFTQTDADFVGKMASGNAGIFHNQASDPFAKEKENFKGISPLKGPHGDQLHPSSPVARDFGTFAISSSNEYPYETIRWIDHFFSDEGSIFMRYGIEGETFYYKEDGLPEHNDEILQDERGSGVAIGQLTPWPGGGSPQYITVRNASAINPPEVQKAQEALDPYLPEAIYGAPLFDEDTSKEVDRIRQDMDMYFEESSAKFITGDLSFDNWDEYVSTIESMGLERLQEIYQEAYDLNYKN